VRQADTQIYPAEYAVGKKWVTRYKVFGRNGSEDEVIIDCAITSREAVTVPAGTFNAFKVEGSGYAWRAGARREFRYWAAPGRVRRSIAFELRWYPGSGTPQKWERTELVSFLEASR
jgi:hypothetical protein